MMQIEKVIYHCYGGSHSSVVSAAIHTRLLGRKTPPRRELLQIPYFDETRKEDIGRLHLFGTAPEGIQVYAMGMGGGSKVLKKLLYSTFRDEGVPKESLLLVNTLSQVNLSTRIGGFLSRGLGFVTLGRPLVLMGILSSYPLFVQLVEEVEKRIKGGP